METVKIHQHLDSTVARHFRHPAARSVIKCGSSWSPTEVSPELASELPILQVARVLLLPFARCLCVCVSLFLTFSVSFVHFAPLPAYLIASLSLCVSDFMSVCLSVCLSLFISFFVLR